MLKLFKLNRSILLFILTISLCGNCMAQKEKAYPAQKENLWGLINSKGQWIVAPQYHKNIYWPDTHSFYFLVKRFKPDKSLGDLTIYNQFGDSLKTYKNVYHPNDFHRSGYNYTLLINEILHGIVYRDSLQKRQDRINTFKKEINSKFSMCHSKNLSPWGKKKFNDHGYVTPLYKFGHQDSLSYFEPVFKHHLILFNKGAVLTDVKQIDRYQIENTFKKGSWGIMDSSGNIMIPALASSPSDIQLYPKFNYELSSAPEIISLVTTATEEMRLKVYNASLQQVFDFPILNRNISHERIDFNNNVSHVIMTHHRDSNPIILLLDKTGNIIDTFNGMKSTHGPIKLFKKKETWQVFDLSKDYEPLYQFENDFQNIEMIGNKLLLSKEKDLQVINLGSQPYEINRFPLVNTDYKIFNQLPYIGFIINDSLLIQSIVTGDKQMVPGNILLFSDRNYLLTASRNLYDTFDNFTGRIYYLIDKKGKTVLSTISNSVGFSNIKTHRFSPSLTKKQSKHIYIQPNNFHYFNYFTNKPALKFGDSILLISIGIKDKIVDTSYNLIDYETGSAFTQPREWYSIKTKKGNYLFNKESEIVASRRTNTEWIKNYDYSINRKISLLDSIFRIFKTRFGNIYLINPQTNMIYKLSDKASKYSFSIYNGVLRFKKEGNWFYVNRNFEIFYKSKGCGNIKITPISLNQFKKQFKRPFWY